MTTLQTSFLKYSKVPGSYFSNYVLSLIIMFSFNSIDILAGLNKNLLFNFMIKFLATSYLKYCQKEWCESVSSAPRRKLVSRNRPRTC